MFAISIAEGDAAERALFDVLDPAASDTALLGQAVAGGTPPMACHPDDAAPGRTGVAGLQAPAQEQTAAATGHLAAALDRLQRGDAAAAWQHLDRARACLGELDDLVANLARATRSPGVRGSGAGSRG